MNYAEARMHALGSDRAHDVIEDLRGVSESCVSAYIEGLVQSVLNQAAQEGAELVASAFEEALYA